MKKVFILILSLTFVLAGCSKNELDKHSKNLTNYTLNLVYNDDTKTLEGSQIVEYVNNTEEGVFEQLFFHLYPNAFSQNNNKTVSKYAFDRAYPNGFSAGGINIYNVKVKGKDVIYAFSGEDSDILIVPLSDKLYPNEKVKIEMEYSVTIPNVNHRFGYGANTINLGNFYPIACVYENGEFKQDDYTYNGDPFYSDMANYEVSVTYPSDMQIGASGDLIDYKEDSSLKTSVFKTKVVRDFAFVLSNKFNQIEAEVDGTMVKYLYYDDEWATESLKAGTDSIHTFNNLFGVYPYKTYTIVQANFLHGGMEYPNLVLISDEVTKKEDYINVIVHETAHQWFYAMVGNNEVSEAYLDEGLTEYATIMFYELNPSYNVNAKDVVNSMLSSYLIFVDVYSDVFGQEFNTSMKRELKDFKSEPEYTYLVYVKGVLLLDNLRNIVGDSAFCLGLKTYFETNKYKTANTDAFINAMSNSAKKDLTGVINSWLNGDVEIVN